MKRRKYANHCVHDSLQGVFRCDHCGATEPVPMPLRLEVYVLWAKFFERQHKRCEPSEVRP